MVEILQEFTTMLTTLESPTHLASNTQQATYQESATPLMSAETALGPLLLPTRLVSVDAEPLLTIRGITFLTITVFQEPTK